MNWDCEYTDTFGGEANYCWVRREQITTQENASQSAIMRAAKAALGITGMRGVTSSYGEGFEFRPYGSCTVAFIMPRY